MKDKRYIGMLWGLLSPFVVIALFYVIRFNYLSVKEFITEAFLLGVHLKIVSVGAFFADLGIFYLFLHQKKNNAAMGVILAAFLFFFLMLIFI